MKILSTLFLALSLVACSPPPVQKVIVEFNSYKPARVSQNHFMIGGVNLNPSVAPINANLDSRSALMCAELNVDLAANLAEGWKVVSSSQKEVMLDVTGGSNPTSVYSEMGFTPSQATCIGTEYVLNK